MLEIKNLSKQFDGNYVLRKISMTILPGKVHGLIGANGSGKSTLMNILNGHEKIARSGGYEGEIYLDGQLVHIQNHRQSVDFGIAMVHQELALFSGMTVAENIKINHERVKRSLSLLPELSPLDRKANLRDARQALENIGAQLDVDRMIDGLSLNQKQFVELARELDQQNVRLLILDEPTSSLNITETKALLTCIREIASRGIAVIFISHRLEEILQVCDTVSVLRDGELVSTYEKGEFSIGTFADDMVGQKIVKTQRVRNGRRGEVLMEFTGLGGTGLEIRAGEVLGVTGLAGQGQELLAEGLFGLKPAGFQVRFKGEPLSLGETGGLVRRGIYYLSDDRAKTSLFRDSPVWKNMIFGTELRHREFLKWSAFPALSPLNRKTVWNHAQNMIRELNIVCRSPDTVVRELSGGNQQKVCISRALTFAPELLFVNEPTRGIDIYSKERILDWLLKMNETDHTTVVITSGELEELARVCDRVAVMYQGEVFRVFEGELDLEALTLSLYGRGRT